MLGRKSITISRPTGGSYVNGRWEESGVGQFTILASVQPLKDNEMQSLEEGRRSGSLYKLYTDTELYTADVSPNQNADRVLIYDQVYEVIQVNKFQSGIISHYKVIISKAQQ